MSNAPKFNVYVMNGHEDACLFEGPSGQLVPHTLSLVNKLGPNTCYRMVYENLYGASEDFSDIKGPLLGHLVENGGFVELSESASAPRYPVYVNGWYPVDDDSHALIMQRDGSFAPYPTEGLGEALFEEADKSAYIKYTDVELRGILGWLTEDGYEPCR